MTPISDIAAAGVNSPETGTPEIASRNPGDVPHSLTRLTAMRQRYRRRPVRVGERLWWVVDTEAPGPVLLLLPGSLGTCEIFYEQFLTLGSSVRLIGVDYPETDLSLFSAGLRGLLDHLELSAPHILGQSLAGYLLQDFGAHHPERIGTLVLSNTFIDNVDLVTNPAFDPAIVHGLEASAMKRQWLDRIALGTDPDLKAVQYELVEFSQPAEVLKERFKAVATAVPATTVRVPQSRIVVVDCNDDPLIPLPSRAKLRDRYPHAAIRTLDRGGHYPHVVNSDAYNRVLTEILAR